MADVPDVARSYKVGKVLSKYDLEELQERLPALWTGEQGADVSLRDLAEQLNVAVVRRTLERVGEDPLEGEAENVYTLLTGDDVSVGNRVQQRNRLERMGVDVDELESDFVTHQAVHTYLTKGLDVSKDTDDDVDPVEKYETRIQRLRSRMAAVMEQSLEDLEKAGALSTGDVDATVSLQAYCQDCETHYELSELFAAGGCNCTE